MMNLFQMLNSVFVLLCYVARKLVQDSRVTIFADAEMQHHRRDAATQYSKEGMAMHYPVSMLNYHYATFLISN